MGDCNIIRLEQTESTNSYALQLLEKELVPEGTIVVAGSQSAGRGVDGNIWESEPGKNITFSVVTYPDYISAGDQFYLNKAISLAVYDLVKVKAGPATRIKWPNDIYYDDGKIAGILIQNGIQGNKFKYCIAGIGLNVNQDKFTERTANAVSLKNITARDFDLDAILMELYSNIQQQLAMLKKGEKEAMDARYLSALYRLGQLSKFIYKNQEISAKITGVNRYGHLVLEVPSQKTIECDLKEIRFLI